MARSSSGGGSRFASANLNDLYGKPSAAQIGGGANGSISKSRYGGGGGMLVLSRPGRNPAGGGGGGGMGHHHRNKVTAPKLTVPAPVNLPSLRKEHAGNDPNISLVGNSGTSGWSKQQQVHVEDNHSSADGSLLRSNSNGWAPSSVQHPSLDNVSELRPGKYTPPGARTGSGSPLPVRPHSSVLLRGEDFPTLQAALPYNPAPSQQRQRDMQQRQRDKQREMREQQMKLQQLSQNHMKQDVEKQPPSLSLQPQGKQAKDELFPSLDPNRPFSSKENRKPNDLSLRPGPLVHLNHTSNWADDERDTGSISRPPEWEDGSRARGPPFYRDERMGGGNNNFNNGRRDMAFNNNNNNREAVDYGRGRDFGWDRDRDFGRNDSSRDWNSGRTGPGSFDRYPNMDAGREFSRDFRGSGWGNRDNYVPNHNRGRDSYLRDDFFNRGGPGDRGRFGGRNGGFDFGGMDFGRLRSPGVSHGFNEDPFMRDFPELGNLDIRGNRVRRKKDEPAEIHYRDPERESFETELERVQKEQEQERKRKAEERERAIEVARREQEERERLAREEEERQRRNEAEAREAARVAEQEALEVARKAEDAKKSREEERQRMQEEEERRKENARRKLLELEERIARREMEKQQGGNVSFDDLKVNTQAREEENRSFSRFPSVSSPMRPRVDSPGSRIRSPEVHHNTLGRPDSDRPRFSNSWKREPDHVESHFPPPLRPPMDAESFYGNFDGFSSGDGFRRAEDKWMSNGEPRNMYSPRFMGGQNYMDREDRWNNRRPPSPTTFGYDADGPSYGRLRQSLPKQPRVPPPPMRTTLPRQSSLKFSDHQDVQETGINERETHEETRTLTEDERLSDEIMSADKDFEAEAAFESPTTSEESDKHIVKEQEFESNVLTANETREEEDDEEEESEATVEKHVVVAVADEPPPPKFDEAIETNDEPEEESISVEVSDVTQLHADIAELLVDSIPKVVNEQVEHIFDQEERQEPAVDIEVPVPTSQAAEKTSDEPPALLPSRLQQTQQQSEPVFNQQPPPPAFAPPQIPLLDRPRIPAHPDGGPMTLQFGLLPGTSLLQGSVPAIQIGSIQMPLQLPPPIGHPHFQFGQQTIMPSFTVHPQAMMQMDQQGLPRHQYHMQPHPDRTLWTQQFVPGSPHLNQPVMDNNPAERKPEENKESMKPVTTSAPESESSSSWTGYANGPTTHGFQDRNAEKQEAAQEHPSRKKFNRRDYKASPAQYVQRKKGEQGESAKQNSDDLGNTAAGFSVESEDEFIEVRSKRQMREEKEKQLREEKERQRRAKPKMKEQQQQPHGGRQRHFGKSQMKAKIDNGDLNHDTVVSTARTNPVPLSNPEVGYEKRTKSPQQSTSLMSDASAFPSFVADQRTANSNVRAPAAWGGFNRTNQEMEAMRYDTIPSSLPEKPSAAPGPINSLLAGEKIQFGAVTMPAFVSPIAWPQLSRKEITGEEAEIKRSSREVDDDSIDSEAEAGLAASAMAVISNDDYVHNADQMATSLGVIGGSTSKAASPEVLSRSGVDDSMSVSLPADLSVVDTPPTLRGPPHPGQQQQQQQQQHLPGAGFPGMEMGTILGGPVYAFSQGNENAREQQGSGGNVEQGRPLNWPHHSGVDSYYGGPPSYTGPFINHGPMPQTLVYTNPYGVGQFSHVSYMPGPMPSAVKQPDWKHTPVSSSTSNSDGGMLYPPQHGNRHMGHDPSVISVMPPQFDYRDVTYHQVSDLQAMQSQWSHIPIHNAHMQGFPMQLRHPPPPSPYHMQQHHVESVGESTNLPSASTNAPVESTDQFPDELGLGDSMSSSSDASAKPISPLQPGISTAAPFQSQQPGVIQSQSRRPVVQHPEKRSVTPLNQQMPASKMGMGSPTSAPWGNQSRKNATGATAQARLEKNSNSSSSPGKLKQVYVAKPSSMVLTTSETSSSSEIFTAEARHA